jgi:hypothetical protein
MALLSIENKIHDNSNQKINPNKIQTKKYKLINLNLNIHSIVQNSIWNAKYLFSFRFSFKKARKNSSKSMYLFFYLKIERMLAKEKKIHEIQTKCYFSSRWVQNLIDMNWGNNAKNFEQIKSWKTIFSNGINLNGKCMRKSLNSKSI